jgi:hypothetical protein
VFAPVLGYVFTGESDEFPGLFGLFGIGHHGASGTGFPGVWTGSSLEIGPSGLRFCRRWASSYST